MQRLTMGQNYIGKCCQWRSDLLLNSNCTFINMKRRNEYSALLELAPGKSHRYGLGAKSISNTLKKISVMHVIKLGFAPVSFPPG
jgi:hypothetical protein